MCVTTRLVQESWDLYDIKIKIRWTYDMPFSITILSRNWLLGIGSIRKFNISKATYWQRKNKRTFKARVRGDYDSTFEVGGGERGGRYPPGSTANNPVTH